MPDIENHVVALAGLELVCDLLLHLLDDVAVVGAPDEPLGCVHRVLRIQLPLALRLVADQLVALVVDRKN